MTNIVGLEFDRTKFDTTFSCETFIENTPALEFLLKRKHFRLKATNSRFMSYESRRVWSWYDLWATKEFKTDRPTPFVTVILSIGSSQWTKEDVPIPTEATLEKKKKADLIKQKKEVHRKEVAERLKKKRKELSNIKKEQKPKKAKKLKIKDLASLLPNGEEPSVVEKAEEEVEESNKPLTPLVDLLPMT